MEEERNFYYNKLREIEQEAVHSDQDSQVGTYILDILKQTPPDFKKQQ